MKLFDPDSLLRWVFVFPHPDDELALIAWLKRLCDAGADVACVWVHSTPVRRAESLRVMDRLGMRGKCMFLGARDGDVCHQLAELQSPVNDIISRYQPDRLVIPAFEQGHLDHDATNLLFTRASHGIKVLEYPLYSSYATRFPRVGSFQSRSQEELLSLDARERDLKREVLEMYPSQRIARNLKYAELRARVLDRESLLPFERLRLQSTFDYLEPQVDERVREKVRKTRQWIEWESATDLAILVGEIVLTIWSNTGGPGDGVP